jgi:hypothetical protein
MSYFYTRNDDIQKSDLNRTFAELFRASKEEFENWADALRSYVTKQWDEQGQPPKAGVRLEDMGAEFNRICQIDTDKMWAKDEQTRQIDCVVDGSRVSVANSFFPNILKAQDTIGEDSAISVYDLFANPNARRKTINVLKKSIRFDGFYAFSPIYRPSAGFKGDLRREARRMAHEVLSAEKQGMGTTSIWFNRSNKVERRTPRISASELRKFRDEGLLQPHHLIGLDLEQDAGDFYRLRLYDTKQGVIPLIFRHLELGAGVAPNNFPAAVARFLYTQFTKHIPAEDPITIYDPSMGFGGRLLAALSIRKRSVHYIGTDPNTENWIKELGISRYEYMARVFHSHIRYGKPFTGTYICSGSEDVHKDKLFQKFKGKVDFIFTSPPYFSAEIYSNEPTQSSIKYKEYDSWRDNFLYPTLKTCAEWLKKDRYLAFNIADINVGSVQYPLEEDTVKILSELGLEYSAKLKMVLATAPSMKIKKQTRQPSTKNFCIINGKWRKYEPVFVFKKS